MNFFKSRIGCINFFAKLGMKLFLLHQYRSHIYSGILGEQFAGVLGSDILSPGWISIRVIGATTSLQIMALSLPFSSLPFDCSYGLYSSRVEPNISCSNSAR